MAQESKEQQSPIAHDESLGPDAAPDAEGLEGEAKGRAFLHGGLGYGPYYHRHYYPYGGFYGGYNPYGIGYTGHYPYLGYGLFP